MFRKVISNLFKKQKPQAIPKLNFCLTSTMPATFHANEKLESITSLITFFDSMLLPIPKEVLSSILSTKDGILLYKTMVAFRMDPYHKIALQKKFLQITFPKKRSFEKQEIYDFYKALYPNSKIILLKNETVGIQATYEIIVANEFGKQESVHIISMLPENPGNRSTSEQEKSLQLTGQKNCDLHVEYKNGFSTLLDIIIGKNINFKGNLIFLNSNSLEILNYTKSHLNEIKKMIDSTKITANTKSILQDIFDKMQKINISNKTPAARILDIQELLIQAIPIIRKDINPIYNPNMIAFLISAAEEQPQSNIEFINKFNTNVADFNTTTSNAVLENIMKDTLTLYLRYKKLELDVMATKERQWVIDFITKYSPHYFDKPC